MNFSTNIWSRTVALASFGALASFAHAASAEARFEALERVRVELSATGKSTLRDGAGQVAVQRHEIEAGGRTRLSEHAMLTHGLGWVRTELDRTGANGLPDALEEVSVRLGWQQTLGPQWRWMATARLGFFGDGAGVDADTFNVPLLALASYASSREVAWSFGVVANAFGDNPVLPVAGGRWEFARAWTLNLGLPRAGVEWQANQRTTVTAGAAVQGGAYRLTRDRAAGNPSGATFANEKLDYREIRLGVGAAWKMNESLTLTADAGLAVDQQFDFHERGVKHRGSDEIFGMVGISGKF